MVFVHHLWGSRHSVKRHCVYLNQLGFDCVSFDLIPGDSPKRVRWNPVMRYFYKGLFWMWMKQIREVLDQVHEDKILYSFSGPALSAFLACEKRKDIKKIICDGGPFADIYKNTSRLVAVELKIRQKILNFLVSVLFVLLMRSVPLKPLYKLLSEWGDIPIFSIRGCLDSVVSIDSIRKIFEPHKNLNVKILEIPEGKHLDGLKKFPEIYKKELSKFLCSVS